MDKIRNPTIVALKKKTIVAQTAYDEKERKKMVESTKNKVEAMKLAEKRDGPKSKKGPASCAFKNGKLISIKRKGEWRTGLNPAGADRIDDSTGNKRGRQGGYQRTPNKRTKHDREFTCFVTKKKFKSREAFVEHKDALNIFNHPIIFMYYLNKCVYVCLFDSSHTVQPSFFTF